MLTGVLKSPSSHLMGNQGWKRVRIGHHAHGLLRAFEVRRDDPRRRPSAGTQRLVPVRPEVVVGVTYLTWTGDNLLRHVSYQGQREDKPARQMVRLVPPPTRRR